MNCKNAQILISMALDGEVSPREQAALQKHLAACEACAREKAEVTAFSQFMHVWDDEEPSEWLAQSFLYKLADLQNQAPATRRRPLRWVFVTAAAVLVVLAIGLLTYGRFDGNLTMVSNPSDNTGIHQPEQPIAVNPKPDNTGEINVPPAPENPTHVADGDIPASDPETPGVAPKSETTVVAVNPPRPRPKTVRTYAKPRQKVQPTGDEERFDFSDRDEDDIFIAWDDPKGLTSRERSAGILPAEDTVPTDKEEAAMVMIARMLDARDANSEAATAVTSSLGEAGATMDETLEAVRGTLRHAAEMIAAEPTVSADDTI